MLSPEALHVTCCRLGWSFSQDLVLIEETENHFLTELSWRRVETDKGAKKASYTGVGAKLEGSAPVSRFAFLAGSIKITFEAKSDCPGINLSARCASDCDDCDYLELLCELNTKGCVDISPSHISLAKAICDLADCAQNDWECPILLARFRPTKV